MTQLIFKDLNSEENPIVLRETARRVLESQNIYCKINNEKGLIVFTILHSNVPAEYQAKSIKMIMDEFVLNSREGFLQRCYKDRLSRMLDEFTETIQNNDVFEF